MRHLTIISLLALFLIVAGCSDDDSPGGVPDPNTAPVAAAGADQTVPVGDPATLNASASSDPEDDPLTYAWLLADRPAGSAADLTAPTAVQTGLTPDVAGDYVVQLIVNDGELDSPPDTVVVTAEAPVQGWSGLERLVVMEDVPDAVEGLNHPLPVRFDDDTIHLYFSGVAFKTYAVVPAYVYRMISTDNGVTWSTPERMAQLEGNYQSYVVGHDDGRLLLIWHDGFHAEIHQTALPDAATVPTTPTLFLDHVTAGMEVIQFSMLDGTMLGMWHPSNVAEYSPFVGEIVGGTPSLTALTSPYAGNFAQGTLLAADRVLVQLYDGNLLLADFDGTSLTTNETLDFPAADVALEYAGDNFHQAHFDPPSGDIYFIGFNEGSTRSAIYRIRLNG